MTYRRLAGPAGRCSTTWCVPRCGGGGGGVGVRGQKVPCTLPLVPQKAWPPHKPLQSVLPLLLTSNPNEGISHAFRLCATHTHSHPQERSPESHRFVTDRGAVSRRLGATGVFGGHPGGSLPDLAPKLWWLRQAAFACVLKLYNLFLTHDQREGKPAREKILTCLASLNRCFSKGGGEVSFIKGKTLQGVPECLAGHVKSSQFLGWQL